MELTEDPLMIDEELRAILFSSPTALSNDLMEKLDGCLNRLIAPTEQNLAFSHQLDQASLGIEHIAQEVEQQVQPFQQRAREEGVSQP
jgi:hypothetical protein